jgi:3-oxoacyl-[acyl-carrier-protein] synthase-3
VAFFSTSGIRLAGVAAALPASASSNLDLACLNASERQDVVNKIGIPWRRIAPPAVCASDLCMSAAVALLSQTATLAAEVEILVFVSQTPDYPIPGNSMLLQNRLGLPHSTLVLDLHQGCAGYVYGLAVLAGMMQQTGARKGLLLVGDTITRCLSPNDRSTQPVFSDAGSATLLEKAPDAHPMYFNLGAEGKGADIIRIRDGGARHPFSNRSLVEEEPEPGLRRMPVHLSMQGIDVLNYSLKYVTPNIKALMEQIPANLPAPDYFVFHQANKILNDGLIKKLGIPPEKAPETLSEYGNTSCATIPITLCRRLGPALNRSKLHLVLSGFGVGFSWGSAWLEAGPICCPEIIETDTFNA